MVPLLIQGGVVLKDKHKLVEGTKSFNSCSYCRHKHWGGLVLFWTPLAMPSSCGE